MKILIVGAGLAGLSLARAFLRKGIRADLVERRSDWREPGLGLFLPGNASRAFGELGLLPLIAEKAMPIGRQDFLDHRGNLLSSIDTDEFWADCGPCLSLPRAEMHALLLASLDGLPISTGRTVASVEQSDGGCEVVLDDRSRAQYDLVVGTDGIHSQMRRLAIDTRPPTYSGNVCWRCFVPNSIGIDRWTVMLARGRTLLAIPVDRSTVYVYADMALAPDEAHRFSAGSDLRTIFADFSSSLAPLLDEVTFATQRHYSRIETVNLTESHRGRVVLIGDAAHACSPSMAEGAGMACEDALVLADAITATDDIDIALRNYAARRRERIAWVQAQCEARDRMRRLPAGISTRLLRYAGRALYRRSYRPLLQPA